MRRWEENGRGPSGSDAARVLGELEERVTRLVPDWRARGPEDPGRVLLECFALALEDIESDVRAMAAELLPRVLLHLGCEPRWPRPARTAVALLCRPELQDAVRIPAGTRVTSSRRLRGRRVSFETAADAWLSPARLRRAVVVDADSARNLPIEDVVTSRRRKRPATPADVALFGDVALHEHIYLGDPAWDLLRQSDGHVVVEWPDAPAFAWSSDWEYSTRFGWRLLTVDAVEERSSGEQRTVRVHLRGPLPDLALSKIEGAQSAWIRIRLPARRPPPFRAPVIAWTPALPAKSRSEEPRRGLPRPIARLLVRTGEFWRDVSLAPRGRVELGGPDDAGYPAVYFGLDHPLSCSLCWRVTGPAPPPEFDPPRLEWACSGTRGFQPVEVLDDTRSLSRSGTLSWEAPDGWVATERFGERLYWLRAEWVGGSYYVRPRVDAIVPGAVEVVEGETLRDHPVPLDVAPGAASAPLPTPPEGDVEIFDRIEVHTAGEWVLLERAPPAMPPREGQFQLERQPGPRVEIALDRPVTELSELRVPRLRVGVGGTDEVPAGTLDTLEGEPDGLLRVVQPTATSGGVPAEDGGALLRRVREEWGSGWRAVSSSDYRRLVRAVDPEIQRVETVPSPAGGVTVVVFAGRPFRVGRSGVARLAFLREYLEERSPLGIAVRVLEPSFARYEVRIPQEELDAAWADVELETVASELRRFLDPLTGGPEGSGYPLGKGLPPEAVAPIIARLFDPSRQAATGGPSFRVVRLMEAEDRERAEATEEVLLPWSLPFLEGVVAVRLEGGADPMER